ncbi:UNVERIFIED_ORG: hypothetical protein ABIB19_002480 [Arthrobacter sp. UYEF10]
MLHDLDYEIGDSWLVMVERHEVVVAFEVAVRGFDGGNSTLGPLQQEPRGSVRLRPAYEDILERRKGAPGVVEDAVEQYAQSAMVCPCHQMACWTQSGSFMALMPLTDNPPLSRKVRVIPFVRRWPCA